MKVDEDVSVDKVFDEAARILAIGSNDSITGRRSDPETAHSDEDALYRTVLQAIADGHPDAQRLAQAALQTQTGGFSRWCA